MRNPINSPKPHKSCGKDFSFDEIMLKQKD